jgi:serine phosphatase RsbU (regulator of sigma subunit)/anti-sigma regulatory factor (Ser/Thr protein kinase)/putative methionine-R-sulfoxide reductase with GAF domain
VRRQERGEQDLLSLGRHALEGAPLAEVFAEATRLLKHRLGATHAALLRTEGEGAVVVLADGWDTIGPGDVVPSEPDSQVAATLAATEPLVVADVAHEARFPASDLVQAEGLASSISVAVTTNRGTWGILGVHSRTPGAFGDAEAAFVTDVALVLAAAIQRAEVDDFLIDVAHAFEEALHQRERLLLHERMLREASQLLAARLPRMEMMDRFVHVPLPDFADGCTITLVHDYHPDRFVPSAVGHVDVALERRLREVWPRAGPRPGTPTITADAIRTGRAQLMEDVGPSDRRPSSSDDDASRLASDVAVASAIAVPLVTEGRTTGAMTFLLGEAGGRRFAADDLDFAEEFARHCSDALERIALRDRAEAARARVALIARVGEATEVDLDARRRLARVTEVVLPALGFGAAAFLADETSLDLVSLSLADGEGPGKEIAYPPRRTYPLDASEPWVTAVRERRAVIADDAGAVAAGQADDVFETTGARYLCVPLRAGRRVLGSLAFAREASSPRYDADDVSLATEVARRAAAAVGQALSYERERETATVLQRSLLPASIPSTGTVRTEGRYVSGTEGVRVGGDWYDVIGLDEGRMLLVIGDVVGHGVRAAALMGQLRTAVRMCALEDDMAPGATLARLNRFLLSTDRDAMATCLLVLFDPTLGRARYASAGHPPALLRGPDGTARYLEGGLGPPLGVVDDPAYRDGEAPAAAGSRLVLFTDGLYERRGVSIDAGLDLLARLVAETDGDLPGICDRLLASLVGGEHVADDVAILAVDIGRPPLDFEHDLGPSQSGLGALRAALRRWLEAAGVDREHTDDLVLAASELAANSIEHGYRGGRDGSVRVLACIRDAEVTLEIRDTGTWREPGTAGPDRGRGLPLVRALADEVVVQPTQSGTEVAVKVRLSRRGRQSR